MYIIKLGFWVAHASSPGISNGIPPLRYLPKSPDAGLPWLVHPVFLMQCHKSRSYFRQRGREAPLVALGFFLCVPAHGPRHLPRPEAYRPPARFRNNTNAPHFISVMLTLGTAHRSELRRNRFTQACVIVVANVLPIISLVFHVLCNRLLAHLKVPIPCLTFTLLFSHIPSV